MAAQYVGTFDIGAYLKKARVSDDLVGCVTCRPGIVLVDKSQRIRAIHLATTRDSEVDIGKLIALLCVRETHLQRGPTGIAHLLLLWACFALRSTDFSNLELEQIMQAAMTLPEKTA